MIDLLLLATAKALCPQGGTGSLIPLISASLTFAGTCLVALISYRFSRKNYALAERTLSSTVDQIRMSRIKDLYDSVMDTSSSISADYSRLITGNNLTPSEKNNLDLNFKRLTRSCDVIYTLFSIKEAKDLSLLITSRGKTSDSRTWAEKFDSCSVIVLSEILRKSFNHEATEINSVTLDTSGD